MKQLCRYTAIAAAVAMGTAAQATVYEFTLSGASEVPLNASFATGSGTLDLTGNSLLLDLTFSGLSTPAVAAHIHWCAPPGLQCRSGFAVQRLGSPFSPRRCFGNLR